MKKRKMRFIWAMVGLLGLSLVSCDKVFDVHPYDVNIKGEKNVNAKQIVKIEEATKDKTTFRFAFISDSHQWLNDLSDEVSDINRRPDIDFVIHGGDMTDFGGTKEFLWTRDLLKKLNKPFVALLGNHDCLGTGTKAYQVTFGNPDFAFIAGRVKFVCLNTNAIEYDYSQPVPNFDFIKAEWTNRADEFDRSVVCMHAPPFTEQFNNNVAESFNDYIHKLPQLMFCLDGHGHHIRIQDLYDDGTIFYMTASAKERKYYIFTITPDDYSYEIIDF